MGNYSGTATYSPKSGGDYSFWLRKSFLYLVAGALIILGHHQRIYHSIIERMNLLQQGAKRYYGMVDDKLDILAEQVSELGTGADSISLRLDESEKRLGGFQEINAGLSEIVGALNRGGNVGDHTGDLKALYAKFSKL